MVKSTKVEDVKVIWQNLLQNLLQNGEGSACWLSLSPTSTTIACSEISYCSKLHLGSLFWNILTLDCVTGRKGVDGEWTFKN